MKKEADVALLIEMGHEAYSKVYNHQAVASLKRKTGPQTTWTRVGANAEMTAWEDLLFRHCSYPLGVGLGRFCTGQTLKRSALLHFGNGLVTENLPACCTTVTSASDKFAEQ